MEGSADLRIVLLGKTGAGKSSTGNSILGEKLFTTSGRANSNTSKCEAKTKTIDGRSITVVDTPGYFSTDCSDENSDEELKAEIAKCIIECSPGPHAFVILLTVGRQTEEEKKVVEMIQEMFGEEALKYAVVLFSHGQQLEDHDTIQQFVNENNQLKTFVKMCGDRLHVIDNKYWNNTAIGHGDDRNKAVKIKKLLTTIDHMVEQNGGAHYTNKMLQAVEKAIEKEEANINEETGGLLSKTIVREKAKGKVMKRFLNLAVGVSTGALLGAFLGVAACVAAVLGLFIALAMHTAITPAGIKAAAKALPATGIGLGTAAGVVAGAGACVGAAAGGVIGGKAAMEAETAGEAASRAAAAVTEPLRVAVEYIKNKIVDKIQELEASRKLRNPRF